MAQPKAQKNSWKIKVTLWQSLLYKKFLILPLNLFFSMLQTFVTDSIFQVSFVVKVKQVHKLIWGGRRGNSFGSSWPLLQHSITITQTIWTLIILDSRFFLIFIQLWQGCHHFIRLGTATAWRRRRTWTATGRHWIFWSLTCGRGRCGGKSFWKKNVGWGLLLHGCCELAYISISRKIK